MVRSVQEEKNGDGHRHGVYHGLTRLRTPKLDSWGMANALSLGQEQMVMKGRCFFNGLDLMHQDPRSRTLTCQV